MTRAYRGAPLTAEQFRDCEGSDWVCRVEYGKGEFAVGCWVADGKIELDYAGLDIETGDQILVDYDTFAVMGFQKHVDGDNGVARQVSAVFTLRLR